MTKETTFEELRATGQIPDSVSFSPKQSTAELFDPFVNIPGTENNDVFSPKRIIDVYTLGLGVLRKYNQTLLSLGVDRAEPESLAEAVITLLPTIRKIKSLMEVMVEAARPLTSLDNGRERMWIQESLKILALSEQFPVNFMDPETYIPDSFRRMILGRLQEQITNEAAEVLGDEEDMDLLFARTMVDVDLNDLATIANRIDGSCHDLRQPVTTMYAAGQFFERVFLKGNTVKALEYLALVRRGAGNLVNDLYSAHAKAIEGKFEKEQMSPEDLARIIGNSLVEVVKEKFPEGINVNINGIELKEFAVYFSTAMAERIARNWGGNLLNKLEEYMEEFNGSAQAWLNVTFGKNSYGEDGVVSELYDNMGGVDPRILANGGKFIRGLTTSARGHGDGMTTLGDDIEKVFGGEVTISEFEFRHDVVINGVKIPEMLLKEHPHPYQGKGARNSLWLPLN